MEVEEAKMIRRFKESWTETIRFSFLSRGIKKKWRNFAAKLYLILVLFRSN